MAWAHYNPYRNANKYHNEKVEIDGFMFDSKKEARRYRELKLLESSGMISDLKRQVKYVLIPAQREPETKGKRGGIKKGKLIERECSYTADFVYRDNETGMQVVEDTKGVRTTEYKLKRKMMLYFYGIRIKEV